MPTLSSLPRTLRRRAAAVTACAAAVAAVGAALPATAAASHKQITIMQAQELTSSDPAVQQQGFEQLHALGVSTVRIFLSWVLVSPDYRSTHKPAGNSADPNYYPGFGIYDSADRLAAHYGITVDFVIAGGAPRWADTGKLPGPYNPDNAIRPSAAEYGRFVSAVGTRYSGAFTPAGQSSPLPRVHFWTIFNEPNFGPDLAPQAVGGHIAYGAGLYRSLVEQGWLGLHATGHAHDTILIGGFAAEGAQGGRYPGVFGETKPLLFVRDLYCLDVNNHFLRGFAARTLRCPTTLAGTRRFRRSNPGLFSPSGIADHPYPENGTPEHEAATDKYWAEFSQLGNLGREVAAAISKYGGHSAPPVYNDEYGYITDPPNANYLRNSPLNHHHYLSPAQAAVNINWAEYLSWRNPRVESYMQYLLADQTQAEAGKVAAFASGLEFSNGVKKATFYAFNLPVWMPRTSFSHRSNVEVWGDARPAFFESPFGAQTVQIQELRGGAWTALKTVPIRDKNGYFDIHMRFPGSGQVRLAYTYPLGDSELPAGVAGSTIYSRSFAIKVH